MTRNSGKSSKAKSSRASVQPSAPSLTPTNEIPPYGPAMMISHPRQMLPSSMPLPYSSQLPPYTVYVNEEASQNATNTQISDVQSTSKSSESSSGWCCCCRLLWVLIKIGLALLILGIIYVLKFAGKVLRRVHVHKPISSVVTPLPPHQPAWGGH